MQDTIRPYPASAAGGAALLRRAPRLGRTFRPADERRGGIGQRAWGPARLVRQRLLFVMRGRTRTETGGRLEILGRVGLWVEAHSRVGTWGGAGRRKPGFGQSNVSLFSFLSISFLPTASEVGIDEDHLAWFASNSEYSPPQRRVGRPTLDCHTTRQPRPRRFTELEAEVRKTDSGNVGGARTKADDWQRVYVDVRRCRRMGWGHSVLVGRREDARGQDKKKSNHKPYQMNLPNSCLRVSWPELCLYLEARVTVSPSAPVFHSIT